MGSAGERGEINDHLARLHVRFQGDWIAPSTFADRGNVNRGAAVPANDVQPFLPVTDRSANLAGVERGGVVAVWFVDHEEANHGAVHVRGVEVQTRIRELR